LKFFVLLTKQGHTVKMNVIVLSSVLLMSI
jgi:hypothetical protein